MSTVAPLRSMIRSSGRARLVEVETVLEARAAAARDADAKRRAARLVGRIVAIRVAARSESVTFAVEASVMLVFPL